MKFLNLMMLVGLFAMMSVDAASNQQSEEFLLSPSEIEQTEMEYKKKLVSLFEKMIGECITEGNISRANKFIKKLQALDEYTNQQSQNEFFVNKLQNERLKRRTFFIGKRSID